MKIELDLSRRPDAAPAPLSSLAGLSLPALKAKMEAIGVEPKKANMRARQLRRWIHHFGTQDFADMTDVAKELRAQLAERFILSRPEIADHQVSRDGTQKWLTRFGPGIEGESVFIPDVGKAGALCVSSQVGCTLNCTFCHTGTQKLVRNLTAQEIVAQVLIARDGLGEWPTSTENRRLTNIVFMGMGEPLYNLDNVAEAIDTISDGDGIAIGRRRITVSTAGVAPKIPELGHRTNAALAISLHATNNDLRNEIVPINRKYDLQTLFDAIRAYPDLGNSKRVTFEYVMLKGVNDSLAEARDLVSLLKGVPAKINLIPFNPWPGSPYECSDWETIEEFAEVLNRAGYASPIRTPRGRDILAACGQLRSESVKKSAAEKRREALAAETGTEAGDAS
ncbi:MULTISPECIES: 23S rRNA (adenine(2503)-C(2))-methyltransferase RlmN [Hyphomonas]|uniref:Dual-specificity RNA methyltransferase RlmN n=1 Tax=Hyphomonas adhaerens TaxID=81029 RepID=A0A3B9GXF7_9PROT|nr:MULTISPECIES: 23S rRNA (adenine(2503)-C(2))-methyltransferase RlmN [Hyphomonas]MBB41657.1 23S rRNA (adenine(2503)-C(2))-methyltransferase RlmN [Hyphomonas sp.]HAE27135.1 23S rRNA (adenine(2503)-C(2))-methyltransferase RlmN [Hyphomonas adhaerens]|tara:strand:+ start:5616 stop:6797 length:1182 start_codon:yes stop_codon:yes gene_type:complete